MKNRITIKASDLPQASTASAHKKAIDFNREVCGKLAEINKDNRSWWYSWASSRDTRNINIMQRLRAIEAAVESALEGNSEVVCSDSACAIEVLNRLRSKNFEVVFSIYERLKLLKVGFRSRAIKFHRIISEIRFGLRGIATAKKHRNANISGYDAIFVTIVSLSTVENQSNSKQFIDSYFGDLPNHFAKIGLKCLIVAHPFYQVERIANKIGPELSPAVLLFHTFLNKIDIIFAVISALTGKVDLSYIKNAGLRKIFAEEIASTLHHDIRARLLEIALKRVLTENVNARLFCLYENIPWERSVYYAAHAVQPNPNIVGYWHNPVFPNNPLTSAAMEEGKFRPDPSTIVCTGTEARNAILSLNAYKEDQLKSGCSLRIGGYEGAIKINKNKIITLVVLLSGTPEMVELLKYLDNETELLDANINFILRGHPNRSVKDLAFAAGVSIGKGTRFNVCTEKLLEDSIAHAEGVIYRSTGALFAAAWRGMPMFQYSGAAFDDNDPLFMRPDIRDSFAEYGELASLITSYNMMSDKNRYDRGAALANYTLDYMTPQNPKSIEAFWEEL